MGHAGKHPQKDIRKELKRAQKRGWTIKRGGSHRWGQAWCGSGCKLNIPSTPRNPTTFAKRIRENVDRCPHDDAD